MPKRHPAAPPPPRRRAPVEEGEPPPTHERITEWARENQRNLLFGAGAVAAVALGIWYYMGYQADLRARAAIRLEEVQQLAFVDTTARPLQELRAFVDQFSSTPAGREGRVVLGDLLLERGRFQEAQEILRPAAEELEDDPLAIQAALLLAKAQEEGGDLDAAEATYLAVADASRLNFQRWDALAYAARIRAERGDRAGAATLYRRILDSMAEEDPSRGLYEMRLAELTAGGADPSA